jgi:parallel beta-helix repeat protein
MKKRMMKTMCGLLFGGAFPWFLPSIGLTQCNVSVGGVSYPSIQNAINTTTSPVTISVTGTCYENLVINELEVNTRLTVPLGQTATITGTNSSMPTIMILGRSITVENFTINGPFNGIQVFFGGTAFIKHNTISTGGYGIMVLFNSYASIDENTITNNLRDGIVVSNNSYANIGSGGWDWDPVSVPNIIQGNEYGVSVSRSSSAKIVGNTISSNTYDGVRVVKVSHAEISDNTIDGNGQNGILVVQNSGVNLGRDTGETIFDLPNSSIVGNGAFGVSCDTGGYADGRLGTLDGVKKHSATHFTKNCIDSLIP